MVPYSVKKCPKCGGTTNVINTRAVLDRGAVIRLRKCFKCDDTFETAEIPTNRLADISKLEDDNTALEQENLKLKIKVRRIEQFMTAEFPKEA